jgi:hypothetical protein
MLLFLVLFNSYRYIPISRWSLLGDKRTCSGGSSQEPMGAMAPPRFSINTILGIIFQVFCKRRCLNFASVAVERDRVLKQQVIGSTHSVYFLFILSPFSFFYWFDSLCLLFIHSITFFLFSAYFFVFFFCFYWQKIFYQDSNHCPLGDKKPCKPLHHIRTFAYSMKQIIYICYKVLDPLKFLLKIRHCEHGCS